MPGPDRVLIDWSAFQALASDNDLRHDSARQVYEALLDQERELWTTSFILLHAIGLFGEGSDAAAARPVVEAVRQVMNVLWIESGVHEEAWGYLDSQPDPAMTYLDWTTFVSARRLRAHVFGYNEGFSRSGVVVVP